MGTFLTYRIAGGEAGMRHFMEQFGPALKWPWTRLTDVPELTDGLLDRIVEQSDAQAAGRSVRELERLRDDCLVAVMQGLRANDIGAGAVLSRLGAEPARGARRERADRRGRRPDAPLRLYEATVPRDWIDYNGHVNDSRYLLAFGEATDALLRAVGVDEAYVAAGGSYYTVETHLSHLAAAFAGDRLSGRRRRSLGVDAKRLHLFHVLRARRRRRGRSRRPSRCCCTSTPTHPARRAGATGDRRPPRADREPRTRRCRDPSAPGARSGPWTT